MRAALVFLESPEVDQLSGTIADPIVDNDEEQSFMLISDSTSVQVCVLGDASVILVDETTSVVTTGTFADLAVDDVVDVFGTLPEGEGCFEASEVIVDADSPPSS